MKLQWTCGPTLLAWSTYPYPFLGPVDKYFSEPYFFFFCFTVLVFISFDTAFVLESGEKKLQETPCILDLDAFHVLVELCLSLPVLYCDDLDDETDSQNNALMRIPSGGLNEQHVLQLMFTVHAVQILLSMDSPSQGAHIECTS